MAVLRACIVAIVSSVAMSSALEAEAAVGRTPGAAAVSTTGAAEYSMPIFAPPGTKGMTPALSLRYSSNAGSGWVGEGWSIGGLSAISRCAQTWEQDGTPRNVRLDYEDRYCLDGNRLRTVSGAHGANGAEYRTELETFSRVKSWGAAGSGPAYFIVERKDGLIFEYGNTTDSRIESQGVDSVRTWVVNKIRDRDGNAILFNYTEDASNGSFQLANVQYTENANQGLAASYRIEFFYEAQPSGEIDSGYLGGRLIKDVVRLIRVDVTYNTTLVRRYHVTYETGLSNTGKSRVQSLQECAGSGGSDCLAATMFTYQNGIHGVSAEINTGASVPTTPWVLDVNGDGRDDLVYSSSPTSGAGTWMVMFGGAGGYGPPVNTGIANSNFSQAISIDYNADGLDDLLVPYSGGTWWVMLGTTSGLGPPANTGTPATATGVGSNAHAMDVDGDGLQDLVWADLVGFAGGDAIRYRLRVIGGSFSSTVNTLVGPLPADQMISNPVWGYTTPPGSNNPDFNGDGRDDLLYQRVARVFIDGTNIWQQTYYTSTVSPGAPGSQFVTGNIGPATHGDFNGDGFSDIVYIINASTSRVRFGTGAGFSGEVFGPSPSGTAGDWVAYDWDGDGNEDILVRAASNGAVSVVRSTGEGIIASSATTIASSGPLRIADVNGDGLMDVAYHSGGSWRVRMHAGSRPDRLASVTDGYGNVTSFVYTSIAQGNYTKYSDASFPEQDFAKPLLVVSSMTNADGIGGSYTQSYWYYGARAHLRGRGMEGFRTRRIQDSRNNLYAYEYFHQLFPHTGAAQRIDLYQPNGSTLISRSENVWAVHSYGSGNELRKLPYVSSSTVSRYEVGGSYNGSLLGTTTTVNSFDSGTGVVYDSVITQSEPATGNGVQAGASYVQRVYQPVAELLNDTSHWCIGRPGRMQSINSHNQYGGAAITRTSSVDWDGAKCRPTAITVEPGNSQLQVTRSLEYDRFGNVSSDTVIGAGLSGRMTHIEWGDRGQFAEQVTNALSQSTTRVWDYAKGVPTGATDPNGITIGWEYDNFGRRTREDRQDGSATTWSYESCASASCLSSTNKTVVTETLRDSAGQFVTNVRVYTDSFDRAVASSSLMLSGSYNRIETEYDALGRVRRQSAPCWWIGCSSSWTTYQYDLVGRIIESSRPVSDSNPALQTAYSYYEGLSTRVVDPLGKQRTAIINAAGLMARSIDHNGYFQSFDYDAFGNARRVTDSLGNTLVSNTFNVRGMRTAMSDITAGNWTYTPNALGELVVQINAKLQATTFEYDTLGRMTRRIEPEGESVWTWGASANAKNIGRMALMTGPGYAEGYEYDAHGRLSRTTIAADATYQVDYQYNNFGALSRLTYPASTSGYRLQVQYEYQNGYLRRIYDYNASSTVFWTGNDTDASGNVVSETLGNGIQTIRGYDTANGRLDYLQSTSGGVSVQDLNYTWDRVGNLAQRQDARQGITESFYYDDLHRLTSSTGPDPIGVSYDARGNITSMTGNVQTGGAHAINWYSYNLPSLVSGPVGYSSEFFYGPDRSRWKQVANYGGTTETTVYIGGLIQKVTLGSVTSWRHMIAGGAAVYTRKSNGTNEIHYLTKDHLGSLDTISDVSGAIEARLSFGAFGQRRNEAGWGGPVPSTDWTQITDGTRQGFTGHEMLDNLNLVHMNGRVYDQHAGRFISPDPIIDGVDHTQGWNRYAYVKNAPLSFTDPTGFKCYSICHPTDPWNGSPLGSAGLHGSSFFSAPSDPVNPDRPSARALLDSKDLRDANYDAVRRFERQREAHYIANFERGLFMDQLNREYGHETGARAHLTLPRHGSGRPRSTVGGTGWGQTIINSTVPGAYYAGQAELAFRDGQYGLGVAHSAASLLEAGIGVFTLGRSTAALGAVRAIGFAPGTAEAAFTAMRGGGGHAIRHLQGNLIPNTGSLASRVDAFKALAIPILENPMHTADWRIGATLGRAFLGKANGTDVVVVVAKEGPYQGQVISSFVPDASQLNLILGR